MKQALIVVDYQNDFVDGALGFPKAKELEEPICQKIEQARKEGAEVIFTFDTHGGDYLSTQEGRKLPVPHCMKNSEGWQLYGQTGQARDQDRDMVICKGAFPSLELANHLREHSYDQVELVGLVSYLCVLSNALMVKAALSEAEIVVDASCTAGPDPTLHEKALDLMEALQMTVINREA